MQQKKIGSGLKQFFVFLGFIFMPLFVSTPVFSLCNPVSATLCVAIDDIADVYINDHYAGQFTYVNWDQTGVYPTCISIDPTWIKETGNIVALDVLNVNCCQIWGSWSIETNCSDGTHSCLSSDDPGMRLYNVPTPSSTPPPDDGAIKWWGSSYTLAGSAPWQAAVPDTGTIYGKLIFNPCTGKSLLPLSYSSGGDGPISGTHIYMRQPFALIPVPTLPPASFTITKSVIGATTGIVTNQRVTYQLEVCNSGNAITDSSVILTDDYDNGFSYDGPYNGDCSGFGDGSPCIQNNGDKFTAQWLRGFPGQTCVTLTSRVVDYYVDSNSENCQNRLNWAGVHWTGAVIDAKSGTVSVQMYCITPSFTMTITPTLTISNTMTITPTRTPTYTRTSIFTLTQTLSFTVSPTITQTWTVSQTWTPHAGKSETYTPTITKTWTLTSTRTWTVSCTLTFTPSITLTATATITTTWVTAINISKSEDKTQVPMGDTVQYCITFTNVGGSFATFDIWDTIPDVTNFLWCTDGCTAPSSGSQGSTYVVDWHLTAVPPGTSGTVCMWVQLARWPYYRPENLKEYFAGLKHRFMSYFREEDSTLNNERKIHTSQL